LRTYLERNGITLEMLLNGNIAKKSMLDKLILSDFYKNCVTSFNYCKEDRKMNIHEYFIQPLWCNRLFTSNGKGLILKHWIQSGFKYVKDVYDSNGKFVKESFVLSQLTNKKNWMAEYILVRKALMSILLNGMYSCSVEIICIQSAHRNLGFSMIY
jgi:hypothetical protein